MRGEAGVVTTVEPRATRVGIAILERGGNAVAAAVAVAYALAVTHPRAGNLGGGGSCWVRPKGGPTMALDFRESAPLSLTRERFDAMQKEGGMGPVSVGVPGSVAGLELAHDRFGRLARADVIARPSRSRTGTCSASIRPIYSRAASRPSRSIRQRAPSSQRQAAASGGRSARATRPERNAEAHFGIRAERASTPDRRPSP